MPKNAGGQSEGFTSDSVFDDEDIKTVDDFLNEELSGVDAAALVAWQRIKERLVSPALGPHVFGTMKDVNVVRVPSDVLEQISELKSDAGLSGRIAAPYAALFQPETPHILQYNTCPICNLKTTTAIKNFGSLEVDVARTTNKCAVDCAAKPETLTCTSCPPNLCQC